MTYSPRSAESVIDLCPNACRRAGGHEGGPFSALPARAIGETIRAENRKRMRIVALLAVYNEERFMDRLLRHLVEQGVESYVIENESTDRTGEIARSFLGRGVLAVETFPRHGVFEWAPLLRKKEELHRELGADWYLHQDADQFRFAPGRYATLHDGIADADKAGYNAVDFDVFDFLPTDEAESFDHPRFVEEMRHYYYFKPHANFQVKAWKNFGQPVNLVDSGGHAVAFAGRRVYPEPFIQRHYIALSREHAIQKYCERAFSPLEIAERGWHYPRPGLQPGDLYFPSRERLKTISADNTWDTSEPWTRRPLFGKA